MPLDLSPVDWPDIKELSEFHGILPKVVKFGVLGACDSRFAMTRGGRARNGSSVSSFAG